MRGRPGSTIAAMEVDQGSPADESSRAHEAPRERLDMAIVAEVLAALSYGERCGALRSEQAVKLAPDGRTRTEQRHVADRERQNWELIEARLRELGDEALTDLFRPYFDAFFAHTEPADWIEAQAFHYVGDALV